MADLLAAFFGAALFGLAADFLTAFFGAAFLAGLAALEAFFGAALFGAAAFLAGAIVKKKQIRNYSDKIILFAPNTSIT